MAPAERADVIVDFTDLAVGTEIILLNLGPDEPFGGGVPGVDFDPADPASTGVVMQFRVTAANDPDPSTPPMDLVLPQAAGLGGASVTRQLTLNEEVSHLADIPIAALLGTVADGPLTWGAPITENPGVGATEIWEIHNVTEDAHPIHVHLVQFQVLDRQPIGGGPVRGPEPWETGFKDTVIAYPDEITRIKARFDLAGLYVWHCHIVEHEDNEMMRPYRVG
jgi:bilirubin oxidase